MVSDDGHRMLSSLEVLVPFLECKDDHQKFSVIDVIVPLSRGEYLGEVCAGMKVLVGISLKEYGSSC